MEKGTLVIKFEDVLVEYSKLLYDVIRINWRSYNRWFADVPRMNLTELHDRNVRALNEYLVKDALSCMSKKQYAITQIFLINSLRENMIKNMPLLEKSKFGENIFGKNPYIIEESFDPIIIYTRNDKDNEANMKKDFIQKNFINKKIKIISIPNNVEVGDDLANKGILPQLLITDNLMDVLSVIKNTTKKTEFLLPRYGYNSLPPDVDNLVHNRECTLRYYEP